ncbi:transposase [Candidatus Bathyarchaeota archaeon]|nr:transposase [Candidatus Bathyarchaeota archaeon]
MLDYKLRWLGLDVKYVNPKNSSKTCSLCSGSMASHEGRLIKCESCGSILDRDVAAVLNLQMWGAGFTQKAFHELIEREELHMSTKDYVTQNPCP